MNKGHSGNKLDILHHRAAPLTKIEGLSVASAKLETRRTFFGRADAVIILLAILSYAIASRILDLSYPIKSAVKFIGFMIIPLIFAKWIVKDLSWLKFKIEGQVARRIFGRLLIATFVVLLLVGIFADPLARAFNVEGVIAEIRSRTDANVFQMIIVALYIPIVNAAIEELFYRGYILQRLKNRLGFTRASVISAIIFSLYHLVFFRNWFHPVLLLLALSGLLCVGLVLNWMTERCNSLLPSWTIHGLMNLSTFIVALPFYLSAL